MGSKKRLNKYAAVILVIAGSLVSVSPAKAQVKPTYQPHEVIDAGNNLKIEILKSRGEGENEEYDVIYYTDKRQLGTRKWEKVSKIKELQQAAKIAAAPAKTNIKTTKGNTAKPAAVQQKVKTLTHADNIKQQASDTTSNASANKPKAAVNKQKQEHLAIRSDTIANHQLSTPTSPLNDSLNTASANITKAPPSVLNASLAAPVYTLDQCFRIALDSNIALQQASNNITANKIDRQTAQYSLLPSVSYNLGHYFSFGKNIDPVTNTYVNENFSGGYTGVGLQLLLFSGFNRLNTIRQSAYLIHAAEYAKKRTELELFTNISLTYARLLLDKEQLGAQRSSLQSIAKEIDAIKEKIKVGRLTKYEFYTFNARLNTEQAELVTVQNDSSAASQDLRKLLNISYLKDFNIAPIDTTLLVDIVTADVSIADVTNNILKTHPAIKQAEMNEQAARLSEKIARSNALPSLYVGGNVVSNYNAQQQDIYGSKVPIDQQLNNNLGQNININLRVPIFSQLQNSNRIKKERINIANAQLAIKDATNTITTNTLQLINDFIAAKAKYKATLSAFEQNSLSYDLYLEKYKLGQVSSVELLTARDILNVSTSKYLQAKLQLFFQYQLLELLKRY